MLTNSSWSFLLADQFIMTPCEWNLKKSGKTKKQDTNYRFNLKFIKLMYEKKIYLNVLVWLVIVFVNAQYIGVLAILRSAPLT